MRPTRFETNGVRKELEELTVMARTLKLKLEAFSHRLEKMTQTYDDGVHPAICVSVDLAWDNLVETDNELRIMLFDLPQILIDRDAV